jgi:hypothetical protein
MSGATVAALLADLIDPAAFGLVVATPAKAANPANREQRRGLAAVPVACEALRNAAKPDAGTPTAGANSQTFAAVRSLPDRPESEQRRGVSQVSQDSQGCPPANLIYSTADLAAVEWSDADMARFIDRRARLLRWGWPADDAEKLAERLTRRDREADPRVNCTDCMHYRPGRCGNHRRAGLQGAEVGRDLAALLQRCPGFKGASNCEVPT